MIQWEHAGRYDSTVAAVYDRRAVYANEESAVIDRRYSRTWNSGVV